MLSSVKRHVARKIDRAVKDATPEAVARRAGESIPVWAIEAGLQELGREIDTRYGNALGGVDLSEIETFKRETSAGIRDMRALIEKCRPGSSAQAQALELVQTWEQKLLDADKLKATIERADTSLLHEVAGMVVRESSGVLNGIAARLAGVVTDAASQVHVNVKAEVNGR